MAILYSYPETLELLPADMLIGTSTIRVAGKKKNITKNFTLELLKNFILDGNTGVQWGTITGTLSNQTDLQSALNAKQGNITLTTTGSSGVATFSGNVLNIPDYSTSGTIPTLDQVLTAGNTSLLDAKVGELYLYDGANTAYGKIASEDTSFVAYEYTGQKTFSASSTDSQFIMINANNKSATFNSLPLTAARIYDLPDAAGTIALISDIPTVGTWGTLNYPTWVSGTPFVKMTAAGTFALDTNTYLTSAVTSVTATSPITSSGGNTPIISTSMATNKLIGRSTTGVGVMEEITIGSGLSLSAGTLTASGTGTVTSVGLTMPSAFSVANSPVTGAGTLAVTGAGVASQYVRGDGTLANFPTSTGGGASVSYYLNGSISQGTIGGVAYKEMNSVPVIGAGTDFTINADGYIAQFITDVGDPNKLLIPAGNWNFETYFSASSGGGSPRFYIELYKYDGATFTLIATNSATPEYITGGTSIDLYFTALAIPATTLLATDRLAVRFYVIHSGRTITMYTEDSHLSQIITTFSTGLTTLNGLTFQAQYFAVGTSGSNFNISSVTDTHTFNLPDASATARGVITTGSQTLGGTKTFSDIVTSKLTINSTTQGMLPPRMTTAQRIAVVSPAIGSIVYDTTLGSLYQYNNSNWLPVGYSGIHALVKSYAGSGVSYCSSINQSSVTGAYTGIANRLVVYPFIPANTITSTALYINVTTLSIGGLSQILIYSETNGAPDIRLYQSTDLDCSTLGKKTVTTAQTFYAGVTYFIGVHTNSIQQMTAITGAGLINFNMVNVSSVTGYISNPTYGSAPNPFGTTANTTGNVPFIGITI